jgi:hypothetical protein
VELFFLQPEVVIDEVGADEGVAGGAAPDANIERGGGIVGDDEQELAGGEVGHFVGDILQQVATAFFAEVEYAVGMQGGVGCIHRR